MTLYVFTLATISFIKFRINIFDFLREYFLFDFIGIIDTIVFIPTNILSKKPAGAIHLSYIHPI